MPEKRVSREKYRILFAVEANRAVRVARSMDDRKRSDVVSVLQQDSGLRQVDQRFVDSVTVKKGTQSTSGNVCYVLRVVILVFSDCDLSIREDLMKCLKCTDVIEMTVCEGGADTDQLLHS